MCAYQNVFLEFKSFSVKRNARKLSKSILLWNKVIVLMKTL
jgi:hypothetical protein